MMISSSPLSLACTTTLSQQPPEWPILSHVDCFSQCQIVELAIVYFCLHFFMTKMNPGPEVARAFWRERNLQVRTSLSLS